MATGTVKWFNATKGFRLHPTGRWRQRRLCPYQRRWTRRPIPPSWGSEDFLWGQGRPQTWKKQRGKPASI